MAARQEIALQIRNLIIQDREKGIGWAKIAEKYLVSKTAVRKICQKFKTTQQISNLPGRGRKRSKTAREDTLIVRQIKKKTDTASSEIKDQLNLNVSTKTIRRRLHEEKFFSRVSVRKEAEQKEAFEFCQKTH